jgi:hypothetical protein
MYWEDHTKRISEMKNAYQIVMENPKAKRMLRKLIGENAIILKWVSKLQALRVWTGFIWVISALL